MAHFSVIASEALRASGSPGGGKMVIALDASKLMVADDMGIDIEMSRRGTLELLSNPTNNVATGTATNQISLFQANSVALKVDRFINWEIADGGIVYMDDVNWLSVGSPS